MKKALVLLGLVTITSSCVKVRLIADLNMISTRNVESKEYILIKNYQGSQGNKKQLKKSKDKTIDEAINTTVRNTPGGEYLKNVKIYEIFKGYKIRYAAEGDVWGLKDTPISHMGFSIGDKVQWTSMENFKKVVHVGYITSFKDIEFATVKEEGAEILKNVKIKELDKF